MLTIGHLWEEYEKFWFFIMCHDWLNVSGHSLLRAIVYKYRESHDRKENSDFLLLRQKDPFGELFSEI